MNTRVALSAGTTAFVLSYIFIGHAKAELPFTSHRYSRSQASEDVRKLSSQAVAAEHDGQYPSLLDIKRRLHSELKKDGRTFSWDVKILTAEVQALEIFCSLSQSEQANCLSSLVEPFTSCAKLHTYDANKVVQQAEADIATVERNFGTAFLMLPRLLNTVAAMNISINDLNKASSLCERSLDILQLLDFECSPEAVHANQLLLFIHRLRGNTDAFNALRPQAVSAHRKLLSELQRVGIDEEYLELDLEQVFQMYMASGRREKAFDTAVYFEELCTDIYGATSKHYSHSLLNSAIAAGALRDWEPSLNKAVQACQIAEKACDENDPFYPYVLHSCAKLAIGAGKHVEAQPFLVSAEGIYRRLGMQVQELRIGVDRAYLSTQLGNAGLSDNLSKAIVDRAANIPVTSHDAIYIAALECRAVVLANRRDHESAIAVATTAITQLNQNVEPGMNANIKLASFLQLRGGMFVATSDVDAAANDLKKAVDLLSEALGNDHPKTQEAVKLLSTLPPSQKQN